MKQLGLALHNYHDATKSFPPSGILNGDPGTISGGRTIFTMPYHHTWLLMILPYMEQAPLYDQTNLYLPVWLNGPAGTPPSQPVVSTQVKTLQCPSSRQLELADTRSMAYTNYAASEGYHWWTTALFGPSDPFWADFQALQAADFSGVFTITKTRRMADLVDGTTNVVACAEVNSTGYKWGGIRICGTGQPRLNTGERVFRAAFVFTGRYGECCIPNQGLYEFVRPDGSALVDDWFPAPSPHAFSPTHISVYGPNSEWPGASSLHAGGLNVVLADGSARFVTETIPWHIWVKINGIEDGNPVTEF
jgi:prepilin-type processing-associated H-X9-DG protein